MGPFTTITVRQYQKMQDVIFAARTVVMKAIAKHEMTEALEALREKLDAMDKAA